MDSVSITLFILPIAMARAALLMLKATAKGRSLWWGLPGLVGEVPFIVAWVLLLLKSGNDDPDRALQFVGPGKRSGRRRESSAPGPASPTDPPTASDTV